jgi:hypothetical protein
VRQTWYDPLGWSGLDKVAPPSRAPAVLEGAIAALEGEETALVAEIAASKEALEALELEVRALGDAPELAGLRSRRAAELAEQEAAQAARRKHLVDLAEMARAARGELARIRAGDWGDPRSHLSHEYHPIPPEESRYGRFVELWSAASVGLLLLATVAFVYLGILSPLVTLLVVAAAYAFVEAAFRRRLTLLLLRLTLLLATIGGIVLAVSYASELLVVALVGLAAVILVDNVRELRGT